MSSAMRTAGQELSDSCQGFVQNVVTGLSRALGLFDQNMTALFGALSEKIDGLSTDGTGGATTEQTAELQRLMSQLRETIAAVQPSAKEV